MLEELKKEVCKSNIDLVKNGLVIFTWGNVSGIDREKGLIVIKPSGVTYENMKPDDMIVVDMESNIIEGKLKPSSDLPTHLVLYKAFSEIGGVVHTHSEWATSWAQSGKGIPVYGTTHADYFNGEIPCTKSLTQNEVDKNYETKTGNVIVECFRKLDPIAIPGVLVNQHGPFSWGANPTDAVNNSVVIEEVAKMAFRTEVLGNKKAIAKFLLDKHYQRKHGKNAYYGQ